MYMGEREEREVEEEIKAVKKDFLYICAYKHVRGMKEDTRIARTIK
jgi:hypothetical protein